MALVPAMVDAVDPAPVIAAGGIADSRGYARQGVGRVHACEPAADIVRALLPGL